MKEKEGKGREGNEMIISDEQLRIEELRRRRTVKK